jgi:hypothetical protein
MLLDVLQNVRNDDDIFLRDPSPLVMDDGYLCFNGLEK